MDKMLSTWLDLTKEQESAVNKFLQALDGPLVRFRDGTLTVLDSYVSFLLNSDITWASNWSSLSMTGI